MVREEAAHETKDLPSLSLSSRRALHESSLLALRDYVTALDILSLVFLRRLVVASEREGELVCKATVTTDPLSL